jgi:excisionase family DNA binding protein
VTRPDVLRLPESTIEQEKDHPKLLDVQGAVAYLHSLGAATATVNFVRGLITSGSVPHIRLGKRFYVTRAAIDAWLERSERRPR